VVVCGGAGGAGGSGALGVADGASSISAPISSQGDWVSVSPPCVRLFLRLIDAQCTSSGCKFTTPYSGLAVISVPVVANSLHTSQVPALVKKMHFRSLQDAPWYWTHVGTLGCPGQTQSCIHTSHPIQISFFKRLYPI
jgi:hypothetical protein